MDSLLMRDVRAAEGDSLLWRFVGLVLRFAGLARFCCQLAGRYTAFGFGLRWGGRPGCVFFGRAAAGGGGRIMVIRFFE